MILVTWNTQGDFTASSKELVIAGFGDATDVFCIQEGGVDKQWKKGYFTTFTGRSVGSKNERCTNYLLIKTTVIGDTKPEEIVLTTIGGGEAGRSPCAVKLGKTMFVSWHSTASNDSEDTKSLLVECAFCVKAYELDRVIIGGDFNALPDDVLRMTLTNKVECFMQVVSQATETHTSHKVIDFFVIIGNQKASGATKRLFAQPSDHYPVEIIVN
jgi:hypothetical protein